MIDRVAQREIGRIALEEGASNCAERTVVKNQLCSGDLDVVSDVTAQILDAANARKRCAAGRRCRMTAECRKTAVLAEIRIRPTPLKARADLRQRLRPDLDNHAFGAFDLLQCAADIRILLQGEDHRLFERELGRAPFGPAQTGNIKRRRRRWRLNDR